VYPEETPPATEPEDLHPLDIATDYFAAHWFCRSGIKGLPRKSQTMGEGVPAAATTAPPLKHLHLQEKS